jgi:hypothetical protein
MTDELESTNLTSRSGGADIAGDANITGDVVGRDKITRITNFDEVSAVGIAGSRGNHV